MMNILVISPEHQDLPNASSEIAAIRRYHQVKILSGPVRERDIELAMEDGPFDIVWWITHGSNLGVLLTDGMLSVSGVGQYVNRSEARLCVLNTCDSEEIALSIISKGNFDIICTIGSVLNQDAIRLGSLLAGELSESRDFREAYEIVAPVGGPYRYLRASAHYRRRDESHSSLDKLSIFMIVLIAIVILAALGIYREVLVVEDRQAQIIQSLVRILDSQERTTEDVRSLESRIIQVQTAVDSRSRLEFGPQGGSR